MLNRRQFNTDFFLSGLFNVIMSFFMKNDLSILLLIFKTECCETVLWSSRWFQTDGAGFNLIIFETEALNVDRCLNLFLQIWINIHSRMWHFLMWLFTCFFCYFFNILNHILIGMQPIWRKLLTRITCSLLFQRRRIFIDKCKINFWTIIIWRIIFVFVHFDSFIVFPNLLLII